MPTTSSDWPDENVTTRSVTPSARANPASRTRKPVKAKTEMRVADDWELDDDEDSHEGEAEGNKEEMNQRIWDNANSRAPAPMPHLVPAPSASISAAASASARPPPAAALQPAMHILKRPSPSASPSPSHAGNTAVPGGGGRETLKEREARYQAARERIFGAGGGEDVGMGSEKEKRARTVRNPLGPSDGEGGGESFRPRRAALPSSNEQRNMDADRDEGAVS
ncbi:hypothetical protein MSAN_01927000 [Mycena sanguinolenta]|uniref:SUZ domain-containing protein n=1 Tax=Mycena sanguinolenta TaxID=230812 RepID=A0A8H7CNN8_9AGAR|nr:hypothetical protein MSAN_01927000 [Mycena sanguinolenta]